MFFVVLVFAFLSVFVFELFFLIVIGQLTSAQLFCLQHADFVFTFAFDFVFVIVIVSSPQLFCLQHVDSEPWEARVVAERQKHFGPITVQRVPEK